MRGHDEIGVGTGTLALGGTTTAGGQIGDGGVAEPIKGFVGVHIIGRRVPVLQRHFVLCAKFINV